ncbi:hypothetical protein niasHT_027567 [Heterodera trifolii]|uniref:Uncharacterized protein n=1 Tax=Heterodera trifolii TaxID=157864 RepID=A0ABD2K587_9BILA
MIAAANKKFASFTLDFRRRPRSPAAVGCSGKKPTLSSSLCHIQKSPPRRTIGEGNWSPLGRRSGQKQQQKQQQQQQRKECHCQLTVEEEEEEEEKGAKGEEEGKEEGKEEEERGEGGKNANGAEGEQARKQQRQKRRRTTKTATANAIGRKRQTIKKGGRRRHGTTGTKVPSSGGGDCQTLGMTIVGNLFFQNANSKSNVK